MIRKNDLISNAPKWGVLLCKKPCVIGYVY